MLTTTQVSHWSANLSAFFWLVLTVQLPWSIEEYASQLTPQQNIGTDEHEADLLRRFPPLFFSSEEAQVPLQDVPCTIVDSHGIIVLWYLPGALTQSRNVSRWLKYIWPSSNFTAEVFCFHYEAVRREIQTIPPRSVPTEAKEKRCWIQALGDDACFTRTCPIFTLLV